MKNVLIVVLFFSTSVVFCQQNFFQVYVDSASLVQDANQIIQDFTKDVNAIKPVFTKETKAVLNTKPYLIFYSTTLNQVNLPIWHQVIPAQKEFFYELGGDEEKGKKLFGLFFNGFFLPHEMGHALQEAINENEVNLYQNEYFANVVAILYWRKVNRKGELAECYELAKKMVRELPNPVPPGEDPIKYFNEHYEELGADPYKYGFFQFYQIVKIYDDKTLPSFDTFIRQYLYE